MERVMRLLKLLTTLLSLQVSAEQAVKSLRGAQQNGTETTEDLSAPTTTALNRDLQAIVEANKTIEPLLHEFGHTLVQNQTGAVGNATEAMMFRDPTTAEKPQRRIAAKVTTAQVSSIERNPMLPVVHDYPAQNGQFGPSFKLGTRLGVLFTNAEWATVRFGNPDGKWLEVKFYMNAAKIKHADYVKFGIDPNDPRQHFMGISVSSSENTNEQWWTDYADFLHSSHSTIRKPGALPLDIEFLAHGNKDDQGKTFASDFYGINSPGAYDPSGLSFDPAYFPELGYSGGKSFPWNNVPYWVGGDYHSDTLSTSFANGLGNQLSFAVSKGGAVEVVRSKNDARLPVPAPVTNAPTIQAKTPTRTPTKMKKG
jgi:hypothetical protein